MKKFTIVLIALFVMGDVCHGRNMLTGRNLASKYQAVQSGKAFDGNRAGLSVKSAAEAAEAENIYMVAGSGYDQTGAFNPKSLQYKAYPMKVELPVGGVSGQAEISGIFNFEEAEEVTQIPFTGNYDAQARTLTIATPFDTEDRSKCLKIATYKQWDETFTAVLGGCRISDEPDINGQYSISVLDELVFDVAADGSLTPRSPWVVYAFGQSSEGIVDIAVESTGRIITEEASLMALPAIVRFHDNTVYAGLEASQPVYVLNYGRTGSDCTYNITGTGLKIAAYPSVDPLLFYRYMVLLEAPSEGEYNGNITIRYGSENLDIPVRANVEKSIDYQSLVKHGTFKFSVPLNTSETYEPWLVTSDITGFPVAVASLENNLATCCLNIEMEVPKGKTGIFYWKGITETMQPNGFQVLLDNGDIVYSNIYSWDGVFDKHPADGYVGIPEGKHTLTFEYKEMLDWYEMGSIPEPQKSYIWDFDLQTYDKQDNLGVLVDRSVDFGTWYLDKFIDGATAEASILNLGTEPLRVTGGTDSESFTVTGIGREVESMETLKALIAFHGEKVGDYDETVTVKTTGGDFAVRCTAKAEKIISDYRYLVKEGNISFGTGIAHPFTADQAQGIAFSSTAKLSTSGAADMDSWLSVSFIVPDGEQGELSWEATNSSNDLFEFMGQAIFTDGTELYIDGDLVKQFYGICNASSTEVDPAKLVFAPGMHCVKFNYIRKSSSSDGNDDRVVISSVGLKLKQNGISSIEEGKTLVSETFYTLDGRRINAPTSGIYIRKSTYSDGTTAVTKVVKH